MARKRIFIVICLTLTAILFGCSKSSSIAGTYVASDRQTIVLSADGSVQYTDPENDDSSTGSWTIKENKIYVDRTTSDGIQRRQIYADIPNGKVDSLFFKVNEDSDGTGNFTEQIFIKQTK